MNDQTEMLVERARHFLHISRHEEAIKLLTQALSIQPNNYEANLLLSASFYEQDKFYEAFKYSSRLIELAPDAGLSHFYHALNFLGVKDLNSAETHAKEAVRIDPYEADFWAILSWIAIQRNQWQKALEFAEQGLSVNPEHVQCLNHKSTCLVKLGRVNELEINLEETLARDPDNYYSHATAGWTQLEKGDHRKAKEHFLESLRLNPGNEAARSGVIQSLKARNWFFRLFLGYYFWIAKFQQQMQWAIIFGIYVGNQLLRNLAKAYPVLKPVSIAVAVLMYLTWIIDPLFNLFLRLDPLGKHVLRDNEKTSANFVGIGLLLALLSLFFWWRTDLDEWLYTMLYFATVIIPITSYYEMPYRPSKNKVGWFSLGLAVLGATGISLIWSGSETGHLLTLGYFIGVWGYGWVANYLAIQK